VKTVLSIAGYDPSSGAGITADLMVFAAHGLFGLSCITALTIQSTTGVRSVHPVAADVVGNTLECLDEDTPAGGIKIGMMGTSDNVRAIVHYLEKLKRSGRSVPVVLDPVAQSSSGAALLDEAGLEMLRHRLLGIVDWVTPNAPELEMLSGRTVREAEAVPDACAALQDRVYAESGHRMGILAKGGHLRRPDDYLLEAPGSGMWLAGEWVETASTHGTGCAMSSAFLSELMLGRGPADAATRAKAYLTGALQNANSIGKGNGAMNHLWKVVKVELS